MRGNNVVGVIFSNLHEELISELTSNRTMGSVPFGGRYRMIDFPLSNMVNSGINKVGVVTKRNYQSLMDHLGSGKAWDLSKRRNGLFILPPFGAGNAEYSNRMESLNAIMHFLKKCTEEYVLLSDCDTIYNVDYQAVFDQHIRTNADMTLLYKCGTLSPHLHEPTVFSFESDGRIKDVLINPSIEGSCRYYLNNMLVKRELLITLVERCISKSKTDFKRDVIQAEYNNIKMYGYEVTGFCPVITSMNDYFNANISLLDKDVRDDLFQSDRPIYTKVRDDMPTKYGLGSRAVNSLIGNGCFIEGEVENCILFKGVHICKGAVVKNCIIMHDTVVGENSNLSYVIVDKDVTVKAERTMMGLASYPVYISKGSIV